MKTCCGFLTVAAYLTVLAWHAAAIAGDAVRSGYERSVSGVVYWDTNANGRRDRDEIGAVGIRITGNRRTVVTDSSGLYTLKPDEPLLTISLSFPSGCWPTTGWFRQLKAERATGVDFGLRRETQALPLVFVQMTDTHGDFAWASEVILQECEALPIQPRFYVVTGDLLSGDPWIDKAEQLRERFSKIGQELADCQVPVFMVPGNHDTVGYGGGGRIKILAEDTKHPLFGNRCWERHICPSHWSFSSYGMHFVGIEYAQYIDGKWHQPASKAQAWVDEETRGIEKGDRTVLLAHSPKHGTLVDKKGFTLGLFGDSHTEGCYFQPGAETPAFGPNVLVSGLTKKPYARRGAERRYTQDGRPTGYRIVVVEKDRIDTFYKAIGEPHTILVNSPRRFQGVKLGASFDASGQIFDPGQRVEDVTVCLDGQRMRVTLHRRRYWIDFEATLENADLVDGFYNLTAEATWPDGRYGVTEPYLLLTGREAAFKAGSPAQLVGTIHSPTQTYTLLVNDVEMRKIAPGQEAFSVQLPVGLLKRLNTVSLKDGDWRQVSGISSFSWNGKMFVDQRKIFAWGYTHTLSKQRALCFDLDYSGPPVRWCVKKTRPQD